MSAESQLQAYCKRKDINPDGQFIQQDGHLFIDGYLIGERDANKTASKFMRLSKEASRQQNERIKELENDLTFKLSESHVITMGKLKDLQELARKVVHDALEYADVHPCDVNNDEVKARCLSENMRALYEALHGQE